MSAPHIILDNLPSLCKNCQIWWKFDVVITKIILLVFLRHGVLFSYIAKVNILLVRKYVSFRGIMYKCVKAILP